MAVSVPATTSINKLPWLAFVYLLMIVWDLPLQYNLLVTLIISLEILNCSVSIKFPLLYVPGTLSCMLTQRNMDMA